MEALIAAIKDMTIGQFATDAMLLFGGLSIFVEITPVKINPLSTLLRWMGDRFNARLMARLDDQDKKMEELASTIDENEIDRIRWEIIDFAISCRKGVRHTENEFDHIIELNRKYHRILDARGLTNGKIDLEYQYIEDIYKKRQEKDDFE